MGQILPIEEYQQDYTGTSGGTFTTDHSRIRARWSQNEKPKVPNKKHTTTIPTEALYPLKEDLSPLLASIFRLLDEAIHKTNEAYDLLQNDELIAAHDSLLHVYVILPELFCCKDIGDGFGAIVNAIFHSMKNHEREGNYSLVQINIIRVCFKRLQSEPFIEFADALDIIMKLERTGFTVEPKHLDYLMDIIDE